MRRVIRITSLIVGVLCLLMFVNYRAEQKGTNDRQTFGFPVSPWLEYVSWYENVTEPNGNTHRKRNERLQILWESWSWLAAVGCLAGLCAYRRLRPTGTNETEVSDETEATW
jgi:hypothetical protein